MGACLQQPDGSRACGSTQNALCLLSKHYQLQTECNDQPIQRAAKGSKFVSLKASRQKQNLDKNKKPFLMASVDLKRGCKCVFLIFPFKKIMRGV